MVLFLCKSYKCYYGKNIDEDEILLHLIWDLVRIDPDIFSCLVRCSNNVTFDLNYVLENYGGLVSKKISKRILGFVKEQGLLK